MNPWLTFLVKPKTLYKLLPHIGKKQKKLVFIKWKIEKLKIDLKNTKIFREEKS